MPETPPDRDDFDLPAAMRAIRDGDEAALASVVERYYARVRRLVHRRLDSDFRQKHRWILSAFSTGDVVQDVFIRVLTSVKEVRSTDEGAFVTYLATTVNNQLLDALRYHEAGRRDARRDAKSDSSIVEALAKPAVDETPSRHAAVNEQTFALRQALRSLSSKQRLLWELRMQEKLSFAEIAAQLRYASDEVARKAFQDVKARLLVGLRSRGVVPTRDENA